MGRTEKRKAKFNKCIGEKERGRKEEKGNI